MRAWRAEEQSLGRSHAAPHARVARRIAWLCELARPACDRRPRLCPPVPRGLVAVPGGLLLLLDDLPCPVEHHLERLLLRLDHHLELGVVRLLLVDYALGLGELPAV